MDINKFTEKSRDILSTSQNLALSLGHQQVGSLHILKTLLEDEDCFATRLIENCGGLPNVIANDIAKELDKLPKIEGDINIFLGQDSAKVIEKAKYLAKKAGDSFIAIERILEAITELDSTPAGKILKSNNIKAKSLTNSINELRKGRKVDSQSAEGGYNALEKYSKDVTKLAHEGKIDPVIGREEEIRRSIQVLSRRIKNNPVLIGEPGVGKTAIIEGIAQRMVDGDVPENLKKAKLVSLDLGSLIAGTKFRGEFEERLKNVLKEITSAGGDIILFIDELHTLVGAGASEGSMDASNLLKPALSRGELHCIGATTLDEYRKHIEKDAALARRFQSVFIAEPTVEDTISILRGIKEKYELHHGIRISDSALVAAATLSDRYISDRFLPDKAIDLMDEAASKLRMEVDSKPENIDKLDRKIIKLKIEIEALKKEKDSASAERHKKLVKQLGELEQTSSDLSSKWEAEKLKISNIQKIKEQLDQAKIDLDIAQRSGNLAKAGELTYGVIPSLTEKLTNREQENVENNNNMLREAVSEIDIANVVSRTTGIPVDKMMSSEKKKLLNMENILSASVIGQEEAIEAISNAIRRSRAGIQDINKPIGSFLFLGPTGVGKTELSKILAQFMFDDKNSILRFDMSEYMEKHAVARLIGAPPGYIGYEEGGALTEAVRRRPYQVILFDEIEKAHPDVFNLLLQVLDDGRLTDSKGNVVNFKNTIIILTSNLGSEILVDTKPDDDFTKIKNSVMEVIKSSFRPEFLNRIDEILIFQKLAKKHMEKIVDIQIDQLQKIMQNSKIKLKLSDEARKWFADKGYNPDYGARPLKRIIQRELQNKLANLLLSGKIMENSELTINIEQDAVDIV